MSTTIVELRTEDEVIRLLMKLDDIRCTLKHRADRTRLHVGATTYSILPGVILNLIESEWLIPGNTSETYELDHKRDDEWHADERVRIEKARTDLEGSSTSPKAFVYIGWSILHHSESMDYDTRGFLFKNKATDEEYLVCEGSRMSYIPQKQIVL